MAGTIPREFIDLLLAKIDLVELINAQIPLKKKTGSNFFACCPFHNEKSASFSVSQAKQFYYCFGCGEHGNAIDFVMKNDHLSFPEAIEFLARQAGMEVPKEARAPKKNDSIPALYDLMQDVANYFYNQMRQSTRAIDYLKQRGISGKTAQMFQLGFAPPGWSHLFDHFKKAGVDAKKLLDTGLVIKKNEGGFYDRFRDRIMFPIQDHRGRMIGFGGRILDQGEPKYLNSPETPLFQKGHELYGLYQSLKCNRQLERVLIVEGYMDVIALFQQDITYAVATLGTATTKHHLHRLSRYTNEIIFCFDGDNAGRKAAWRALEVVLPEMTDQLQVRFLFLPDGEDPDSMVNKEGKAAFETRLGQALSLSSFLFETLSKACDLSSIEGRSRLASMALKHIQTVSPGLYQSILLDELHKRSRINVEELKKQLSNPEAAPTEAAAPAESAINKKLPAAMHMTLALLVQHPHLGKETQLKHEHSRLTGFNFLKKVLSFVQQSQNPSSASVLEHWRDQKEQSFIAKLVAWEHLVPETGLQKAFQDALQQVESLIFDEEINHLLAKAAQNGLSQSEKQELAGWIAQKKQGISN